MDFERLSDDWLGANELIVFGFRRFGSRHLPILMEDFDIEAIIDNDMNKADTIYKGIHIINFQQIKENLLDTRS